MPTIETRSALLKISTELTGISYHTYIIMSMPNNISSLQHPNILKFVRVC